MTNDWKLQFLTPQNSTLLLVDYQPSMFKGVESNDRTSIKNAAVATAKAASILEVPTVLSSIWEEGNGEFDKEIVDLFPGIEVYERAGQGFDALEDENVMRAVNATGHKKIVVSGLWTSMCFAFTALHGLLDGFEVYGLMDAAGDATDAAHHFGIQRMLQAGVAPVTWEQLVSEWMHDWANPKVDRLKSEVYGKYDVVLAM